MPTYEIDAPNGRTYEIDGPPGATQEQIRARVIQQFPEAGGAPKNGGWPDALSFMGQGVRYEPKVTVGPDKSIDVQIEEQPNPQGPLGMLSTIAAGGGGALARYLGAGPVMEGAASIFGGTVGGEAGGQMQGLKPGVGALVGGIGSAAGEGLGALTRFLANYGIGAKANVNEQQSRALQGVMDAVHPTLGGAVDQSRSGLSPYLKGGQTAAAIQETALGQGGKRALGDAFEQGMLDTTLAAGGQGVQSKALQAAWDLLPTGNPLADKLKASLAPSPNGTFSANQAERLLAELGEAAFKGEAASPIARGIGGLELRKLYEQARQETITGLPPAAGEIMDETRRQFAAGNALVEAGRESQAFQGLPNRVMLNTPAIQKYVSDNRAELQAKLGDEGYRRLIDAIYAGGQVGTRDIPTPGSGEMLTALRQTYGRGQGGAPQIIGSAVRTALPNLGAQMTGRGFFQADPALAALFDYLGISAVDQFRRAQQGQPVSIWPNQAKP